MRGSHDLPYLRFDRPADRLEGARTLPYLAYEARGAQLLAQDAESGEAMSYVICRMDRRRPSYVTPAGSEKSYTRDLAKARRFPTREAAQAEACENEEVRNLYLEARFQQ